MGQTRDLRAIGASGNSNTQEDKNPWSRGRVLLTHMS
jgi:hypothetical protein